MDSVMLILYKNDLYFLSLSISGTEKKLCTSPGIELKADTGYLNQCSNPKLMIPTSGFREFPLLPGQNKPEPAGNMHGTSKQYSSRKHTVPGTVLLLIFPVTGITKELASVLPETQWNAVVSTRKLTESTRIRVETDGMHNRIFFLLSYRLKIHFLDGFPI
jgi:hypothetical protein